jgi:hypothetical protein
MPARHPFQVDGNARSADLHFRQVGDPAAKHYAVAALRCGDVHTTLGRNELEDRLHDSEKLRRLTVNGRKWSRSKLTLPGPACHLRHSPAG